ncbi:MAG: 3-deoxy-manno-octulosonate cytidylyltransferase [Nitrospira sp.]|nr:3-deoxy-manno-octulosonate cytidylyltransferase [Candidatus Manganitrophaceae bacterium]HIL34643.1 3-deoxy-manno-octulosonate cytidylyltransferase [Candidatus Manganitrophaceae bacterium]
MSNSSLFSRLIVIPARYQSQRFPGKPLADLNGKPMIQHVWERTMMIKHHGRVIVATDDKRIADCARGFGAEVSMTSSSHQTGTERVAEVAEQFDSEMVVNLQGDLPVFLPGVLDDLLEVSANLIGRGFAKLVTVKSEILSKEEIFSQNTVKVVTDRNNRALYFSRSPIPYIAPNMLDLSELPFKFYKHYGIYIYKKEFLLQISKSSEGPLEKAEKLEQLRILEEGERISVVDIKPESARFFWEVNAPEDLVKAKEMVSSNSSS